MTKDEVRHLSEMLAAYADGEVVQYQCKGRWYMWLGVDTVLLIIYPSRIKPKPRVFWANLYYEHDKEEPGGQLYTNEKTARTWAGPTAETVRIKVLDDD